LRIRHGDPGNMPGVVGVFGIPDGIPSRQQRSTAVSTTFVVWYLKMELRLQP